MLDEIKVNWKSVLLIKINKYLNIYSYYNNYLSK